MKRLSVLGFVGVLAGILAGCPIGWSDGSGNGNGGFSNGCFVPQDCPANDTCGSDGICHPGDCTTTTCVAGYTCVVNPTSQTASCQPSGTGGSPTTTSSSSTSTSTSSTSTSSTSTSSTSTTPPVYCGHPADCTGTGQICGNLGTCVPGPCSSTNTCVFGYTCGTDGTCQGATNACDKDSDCASGSLCIAGPSGGGICTASDNQCFDQSQCGTNENCVAGKCTLSCTTDANCRDGYKCDTAHNICTVAAQPCTITNDCGSPNVVCVGGACVPRSNNGTCTDPGDVWTENGCIPNQAATFNCSTDGQMGSGNGVPGVSCKAGSICLHHDCWYSCDAPNQNVCSQQPILNTCKPVADNGSTYNVCGTPMSLGSQCGAGSAGNAMCSNGFICIDGYCK